MSLDFLIVLACSVLGLLAHGSRQQSWLAWILRAIIGISLGAELLTIVGWSEVESGSRWGLNVLVATSACTALLLFFPVRAGLSYLLSVVEQFFSGQALIAALRRANVLKSFLAERVFVPSSMPHLVALWIYVTTAGFLIGSIDPNGMNLPSLPIPLPVQIDTLLSYNGLGLVMLAACGVGIFVSRAFPETLRRLALVKPTLAQVGIGLGLVLVTFAYDAAWAYVTHQMPGNLASKLAGYNAGTFTAGGALGPSALVALATALCAGIGEETLIRGALQPAFGLLPAAVLHGLLHGQFNHAPIFMIQVAGWSTLMGITRRYTNTTTTIIGHAGFNFFTTFLFAFNP